MEKEFKSLSEKISATSYGGLKREGFCSVEDIKEFIKIIEKEMSEYLKINIDVRADVFYNDMIVIIKKRAGDKLTK